MIAPLLAKTILPLAGRLVLYLLTHPKTAETAFAAIRPLVRTIIEVVREVEGAKTAAPAEPPAGG